MCMDPNCRHYELVVTDHGAKAEVIYRFRDKYSICDCCGDSCKSDKRLKSCDKFYVPNYGGIKILSGVNFR